MPNLRLILICGCWSYFGGATGSADAARQLSVTSRLPVIAAWTLSMNTKALRVWTHRTLKSQTRHGEPAQEDGRCTHADRRRRRHPCCENHRAIAEEQLVSTARPSNVVGPGRRHLYTNPTSQRSNEGLRPSRFIRDVGQPTIVWRERRIRQAKTTAGHQLARPRRVQRHSPDA